MRAARYYGVKDVRLEDLPKPEPGPGEVLVKVAHNGICGSDLHEYFSSTAFIPTEPHPLTGVAAPVILGHEFAGTVVDVGKDVDPSLSGARASIRPTYSCGACVSCKQGLTHLCRLMAFHGLSAKGGGLSEFTTLPANMVHPLPEDVSLELGALVEPMAVSYHAVERVELAESDLAVIVGAGPIGLGLWFALRAKNHDRILIVEPSATRRSAISALGAESVIDPTSQDLAEAVFSLTDNRGAAVVFDAAGVAAAIVDSVPVLAPRGTLVVVGVHEHAFDFNPTSLIIQEVNVIGSIVYDDSDYSAVISHMAAGRYDLSGWIEHVPLDGLIEGFELLRAGSKVKILVDL